VDDLVDTTQMYLKSVLELEEEGIRPLRARIAERLEQSGPTVSQTVGRMQRDDLLIVSGDRHLEFTTRGRSTAIEIMRKHRLAECLLSQVIGLDWEHLHEEACRWEHVMSDEVEERLVEVLGHPTHTPYGNPIPALDALSLATAEDEGAFSLMRLLGGRRTPIAATIRWIGEPLQVDPALLVRLRRSGLLPNRIGRFTLHGPGVIVHIADGEEIELPHQQAAHLFVTEVLP
jgi:DtxR family Mn-dependent transcriptional regulator